jgi:DNA-binding transcriptional LysR family regulator
MNITPSAVSQQLGILEREAGAELLEKAGRGVRLTAAGALLVRHADRITGAIAAAEADLAALQHVVTGTLRVAAFPTAARSVMPPVMTALSALHPALRITLRDLEARESLSALQMDDLDVAIVDEYDEFTLVRDDVVEVHEFLVDPLYLALPPDGSVSIPRELSDLRDAFWVMDAESSQFFQVVVRACRASGFEPHIRSNCKDYSVIIALVEAGLGVSMLPGLALHARDVSVVTLPTNPPLTRRVGAAIRPERRAHPALVSILAELRRFGAGVMSGELM